MLKFKVKLLPAGTSDTEVNINLNSEYMLGGLSEDIDNLVTGETDESINDTEDGEKLRFMPSAAPMMKTWFFSTGSSIYVTNVAPNEFTTASTSTSEFKNSLYIFKIFDSTQEEVQNLIHTGYLNGFNFSGLSSNYLWNENFEYGDIHVSKYFLDGLTRSTVDLYMKINFYSAKTGRVYPFSRINPTTGNTLTEADLYNKLTFNPSTKRYIITLPFDFYEITNTQYVELINDSVESVEVAKPTYPNGNSFDNSGRYVTID